MEKRAAFTYAPSRWKGIFFLTFTCTLLTGLEVFLIRRFDLTQVSLQFFLMLIALIIFGIPLVFLLYRLFSLIFSFYRLERDGLHIQWGLRTEVIPLSAIEWIRSPREMTEDVPWSVLPMPGAYLGTVGVGDHTTYEFLASDMGKMLFVGTSRYIYAISPQSTSGFLTGFERMLQMGVLSDPEWTTARPGNWLLEAWRDRTGRVSTILSMILLAALYIWTGSRFQTRGSEAVTSYEIEGASGNTIVVTLLTIPMIATVLWLFGSALGMLIFQQKKNRRTAELVWAAVSAAVLQCLIGAILIFGRPR